MHASTHTLELDPAVAWRLVVIPRTRAARANAAAIGERTEFTVDVDSAEGAQVPARRTSADVIELAFFISSLAAIALLHVGLIALVL